MSIGVIFLLLILVIIVNTVISFVIGNRFYKMAKKDSHIQAEIRALRRDIDEKLIKNVKEVKESASTVENSNPSYAKDKKIEYKEPQDSAYSEIAKRWNVQVERDEEPKSEHKKEFSNGVRRESDYQPQRKEAVKLADDSKDKATTSKAKEVLGNIFPFNDED